VQYQLVRSFREVNVDVVVEFVDPLLFEPELGSSKLADGLGDIVFVGF
jgi:hypothetical protein